MMFPAGANKPFHPAHPLQIVRFEKSRDSPVSKPDHVTRGHEAARVVIHSHARKLHVRIGFVNHDHRDAVIFDSQIVIEIRIAFGALRRFDDKRAYRVAQHHFQALPLPILAVIRAGQQHAVAFFLQCRFDPRTIEGKI